jgi:coproporphyrinogen III oxidase
MPYGERERDFRPAARRYANSTQGDRGTLFIAVGRTHRSDPTMPPIVKWRYDWKPEPGSEAALRTDFLVHKDWLAT